MSDSYDPRLGVTQGVHGSATRLVGLTGGATAAPTVAPSALRALVDSLPVGIFTVGPDQRIRLINGEAQRLTQVPLSQAVGRPCRDVFHCSFCDAGEGCVAQEARALGQVRRDARVDMRRADGSELALRVDAVALGEGEVALTLHDVTETERLRRTLRDRWVFHGMVGASAALKQVVSQVRDVAPTDATVLVLGESGTGKEMVARAVHAESPRAARPFVTVNCSAYSEVLLESELFGHVRGAFPGADRDRAGRLEMADGGTVFLDEVADVPVRLQVKLLRVLQERELERVGESRARSVDVRMIAGTSRNLYREVREGRFREDLFYRINVFTLHLPPLRERRDDIGVLIDALLQRAALKTGKDVLSIAPDARERLQAYAWPGNVRELQNALESAVVRSRGDVVALADLPSEIHGLGRSVVAPAERMRQALERAAGSVTLAARLLGVHRTTLWRWMTEAGLSRTSFQPAPLPLPAAPAEDGACAARRSTP